MKTDTIIVGGGLFGQITAAALREQGQTVLVFDRGEAMAGSTAAACLMKPTWFSSLGKDVYEPSLELLDRLYGVHDLPFDVEVGKLGKLASTTVHWCDPTKILAPPTEDWNVIKVGRDPGTGTRPYVDASGPGPARAVQRFEARTVIVAAGIWSGELIYGARGQVGQRGMSTLLLHCHPPRGKIRAWAPYKQLVGFDRGDGMWVGDGTAIKAENWDEERTMQVARREAEFAQELGYYPLPGEARLLHGIRPYAKGHKPCLLAEVEPGIWVSSGGAKNGTLAAGWAASQLARRLA